MPSPPKKPSPPHTPPPSQRPSPAQKTPPPQKPPPPPKTPRQPDPRHSFGRDGEDAAEAFLSRLGFDILARNVRTSAGEIDLVALDGEVVVFVEVKARRRGGTLEAVDVRKQRRLSRLAIAFLARAGWLACAARFDVVGVDAEGICTHVVNAFDCAPGT